MPEVNKTIVENTTTHIDRIPPKMSVDERGNVTWTPVYRDHNAAAFHRGKTVTNAEFNELFLKGAYQANYLSDTLKKFFNEHLNAAIFRSFTTGFDIVESFVKPFTTADWGAQQEDGYYYINIPAEEHGFIANDTAEVLERMSIATQMFLLGADDKFYEVSQVEIDTYNNVRLYTDDNTLSGVVIIKMNDKAYTLAGEKIDASFVQGLATVGISGKYADLIDTDIPGGPNTRLASLEDITQNILLGETTVPKAEQANVAERILSTSYIQGIKVSNIFETGSNFVKNATNAVNAENAENATNAVNAESSTKADYAYSLYVSKHINQYNNYIPTIRSPGLYACALRNRADSTVYTVMLSIDNTSVSSVGVGAYYDGTYNHGVKYNPDTKRIEVHSNFEDVFTLLNVRVITSYYYGNTVYASQYS